MSHLMLDDKNTMNDMNPFVNFMPGSSRQPHAFGDYKPSVDEPEEEPYKSPACDVVSKNVGRPGYCLLYTSPSPRDQRGSRMPSSA